MDNFIHKEFNDRIPYCILLPLTSMYFQISHHCGPVAWHRINMSIHNLASRGVACCKKLDSLSRGSSRRQSDAVTIRPPPLPPPLWQFFKNPASRRPPAALLLLRSSLIQHWSFCRGKLKFHSGGKEREREREGARCLSSSHPATWVAGWLAALLLLRHSKLCHTKLWQRK